METSSVSLVDKNTFKWWIGHSGEMEKDRDRWRKIADALYHADCGCKACMAYEEAIYDQKKRFD
jgi:hypothetical protein